MGGGKVPLTEGLRALEDWFEANGDPPNAELGRRLGISGQAVSAWRHRNARPDSETRDALSVLLNISTEAWFTPAEVREREERFAALRPTGTG